MSNLKLLLDIYFVIEKDANPVLIYTKDSQKQNKECISVGATNGIQVWATDIDSKILKHIAETNEFGSTIDCISHLHSNLTSSTVTIDCQAEQSAMIIHIGAGKPLVRLSLQQITLPATEIQRLLFQLARHSVKLQEEIKKHSNANKRQINLAAAASASVRPAPKLKPVGNIKPKKTPGMSVVNPRSRKLKNKASGVQFEES